MTKVTIDINHITDIKMKNRFMLVINFVVMYGLGNLTISQASREYDAYEAACEDLLLEEGELLFDIGLELS